MLFLSLEGIYTTPPPAPTKNESQPRGAPVTGTEGVGGADDWSKARAMTESGEFVHVFVAVHDVVVGG